MCLFILQYKNEALDLASFHKEATWLQVRLTCSPSCLDRLNLFFRFHCDRKVIHNEIFIGTCCKNTKRSVS